MHFCMYLSFVRTSWKLYEYARHMNTACSWTFCISWHPTAYSLSFFIFLFFKKSSSHVFSILLASTFWWVSYISCIICFLSAVCVTVGLKCCIQLGSNPGLLRGFCIILFWEILDSLLRYVYRIVDIQFSVNVSYLSRSGIVACMGVFFVPQYMKIWFLWGIICKGWHFNQAPWTYMIT